MDNEKLCDAFEALSPFAVNTLWDAVSKCHSRTLSLSDTAERQGELVLSRTYATAAAEIKAVLDALDGATLREDGCHG